MSFSANRMDSNRNNEVDLRFDPQRAINRVMRKPPPTTKSQAKLIKQLREKLNAAGVNNDFIIEPTDSYVASHIIRALIRLANKHGVDTGKGRKTLNGM